MTRRVSRYLHAGYRRRNYIGVHQTRRYPPAVDPWAGVPLLPANYVALYANGRQ